MKELLSQVILFGEYLIFLKLKNLKIKVQDHCMTKYTFWGRDSDLIHTAMDGSVGHRDLGILSHSVSGCIAPTF